MRCEKSSEIVAYLKGEVGEADREPLRLHFESCPTCSKDLARFDRTLRAFGKLERMEPTPGFAWRVRQAFAAAHPEFLERTRQDPRPVSWWESLTAHFDYVPAWTISVAVHVMLLAAMAIIFLAPKSDEEELRDAYIQARPRPVGPAPDWRSPERDDVHADFAPERPRTITPRGWDTKPWAERIKKDGRALAFLDPRSIESSKGEGLTETVRPALGWLSTSQQADGRWIGDKRDHDVGLTGLALLAFLGDGHTPSAGAHRDVVGRGVRFLLAEQKSNGGIGGGDLYDHGIAALALLETYVMTRDESLAAPVSAAVSFTVSSQNDAGGWGYRHRDQASDTSVGGWQIFLLRMAFANGDRSVIPALHLAHEGLAERTDDAGRVGYRARSGFPNGSRAMTAVGMLSHLLSTHTPDSELLERQTKLLLEADPILNDLYFAYFGSLALFQRGGDAWDRWFGVVKKTILAGRQGDGGWPSGFDKWSGYGGRVYTTAMSALVLETPWRYPRLLE